ncbi:hypothetical protein V6N13_073814 [Hibiscus sabdariffa]
MQLPIIRLTNLDFTSHHQVPIDSSRAVNHFPACDMSYSEYTPCQDKVRGRKFPREMMKFRERHCPAKEEQLLCLIPAPPNYKTPFKWPQSVITPGMTISLIENLALRRQSRIGFK